MADDNWSEAELKAAVDAYLEMLGLEKRKLPYSKTEVRNRLLTTILSS